MTDPRDVREALRRLARSDPVPPWYRDRVIERAAAASGAVEDAAAFAATGGRERLSSAVEGAERDGNEALASEGRELLAAFEAFERACSPESEPRRAMDDAVPEDRSGPLPPRSRNP